MTDKREAGELGLEVLAGGLAAVTAALIGSRLGLTGTVIGAGLASVVSTVAAALYLRSVRTVATRTGVGAVRPQRQRRTPGWPVLVAGGVLAFGLGMLVITGVEWVRGAPLSGGQGTTIGAIVAPHPRRGPVPVQESVPSTGTTETTTTTPPPTTTTSPTPPTSQTPTTTSSPSATTTTTTGLSGPSHPPQTGSGR